MARNNMNMNQNNRPQGESFQTTDKTKSPRDQSTQRNPEDHGRREEGQVESTSHDEDTPRAPQSSRKY